MGFGCDAEARRHRDVKLLETVPGIGKLRAAQVAPIIVSPHRFRTKRQLWSYCGLGIVMRSSSDWVQDERGNWHRDTVNKTRGLNRNHNAVLKSIFKGAATTVIGQAKPNNPLYRHYVALVEGTQRHNSDSSSSGRAQPQVFICHHPSSLYLLMARSIFSSGRSKGSVSNTRPSRLSLFLFGCGVFCESRTTRS